MKIFFSNTNVIVYYKWSGVESFINVIDNCSKWRHSTNPILHTCISKLETPINLWKYENLVHNIYVNRRKVVMTSYYRITYQDLKIQFKTLYDEVVLRWSKHLINNLYNIYVCLCSLLRMIVWSPIHCRTYITKGIDMIKMNIHGTK